MARRRTTHRSSTSTWLLAFVVTLVGAGLVATAGWVPVLVAVVAVAVLMPLAGRRRSRRRKSRR